MSTVDLSLANFPNNGCANIGKILDEKKSSHLREFINKNRPVNESIFYNSKEEFEKHGRWQNYSPGRTDHNFLLSAGYDLSFIEANKDFVSAMEALCGKGYEIFKKSVIRSVPGWAIPNWIYEYVRDVGRPNLNPFVRNEFQDVQYFHCTDFHQDKTRKESQFVTVYVYLDKVSADYSALRILVGSHKLGMTTYPHALRRSMHNNDLWFYSDAFGNNMKCDQITVTGDIGSISCFHSLTLHGTVLNNSKDPRISLRYLISPQGHSVQGTSLFHQANALITGPQFISMNRTDVNVGSGFVETGSSLLSYEYAEES